MVVLNATAEIPKIPDQQPLIQPKVVQGTPLWKKAVCAAGAIAVVGALIAAFAQFSGSSCNEIVYRDSADLSHLLSKLDQRLSKLETEIAVFGKQAEGWNNCTVRLQQIRSIFTEQALNDSNQETSI
jgi:hypothetical protein